MPTQDMYGQNIRYPVLSDASNAETAFGGVVNGVVPQSNMRFANENERAANLPNAVEGMETYLVAEQRKDIYRNGAWQEVIASRLPWANVTLATGFVPWVGNTVGPRVRREGNIVYLEGRMMKSDTSNIDAQNDFILGTVPQAYWPVGHYAEGQVSLSNAGAGAPVGRIEVWPDLPGNSTNTPGAIHFWSDKATQWVGFSSWWFVN